jgi:hypothetical protein
VAIEDVDGLFIDQVDQNATGSVSISTVNGDIVTVSGGGGVTATSGAVSLYAGGDAGIITLGADVATTGGGVSLTAENGDITLDNAGVRVAGAGDIVIKVPRGGLVNATTAVPDGTDTRIAGWLTVADGSDADTMRDFNPELQWLMRQGMFEVNALNGEVTAAHVPSYLEASHLANGTVLRAANGAFLQSAEGDLRIIVRDEIGARVDGFMFSPLAIVIDAVELTAASSERQDVIILTTSDVEVATDATVSGSKGGTTETSSLSGAQTITGSVDASGKDISIRGNDVEIAADMRSAGAVLAFTPLNPSTDIVLGDALNAGTSFNGIQRTALGNMMHIDNGELSHLQDGFEEIVIGGEEGSYNIYISETGSTSTTVTLNDNLTLRAPSLGGEVHIERPIVLEGGSSLVIDGSGHTTTISADITTSNDAIVGDSMLIVGDRIILAGSDGTGRIQLGASSAHWLDGDGDVNPDTLTLSAPGNVRLYGALGVLDPLEELTIGGVDVSGTLNNPDNVTFDGEVTMNGDLTITATGTVTFREAVTLNNGGSLRIHGASQVVFERGVVLNGGGDLFVEADEISFLWGGESVVGSGVLTLRPTTVNSAIEIGTPPHSNTASTLNIDINEIQAFADGFSKIVIGHESGGHAAGNAGAVRVGAMNVAGQPMLRDSLEIYGGSIVVEDYSNPAYTLLVYGDIKLDAVNDINIYNQIEARTGISTLEDVVLYSESGAITQSNSLSDGVTSEAIRAANLDVHAAIGITLAYTEVDTLTAENSGASGDIVIDETATGGDIDITRLTQLNAAGTGDIVLTTAAGDITVLAAGGGISTAGQGNIELGALGAATRILINDALVTQSGSILLDATGDIVNTDDAGNDGTISTQGGLIQIASSAGDIQQAGDMNSAGALIDLSAAGDIVMHDGVRLTSQNLADTGAVRVSAGESITLSLIEADGAIGLTAVMGGIFDGRSASGGLGEGLNLDGDSAVVMFDAATGIGTGAAALQTRVATISASNAVSGGLYLSEMTALELAAAAGAHAIDLSGDEGNLSLITLDGGITVTDAIRSTGDQGNMLLSAGELAEGTAANLDIRSDISVSTGSLSLLAKDSILIDNLGDEAGTLQTLAAGQTLDLLADEAITFEADAQVLTNDGNVRLESTAGSTLLGSINVGDGDVSIKAGDQILDARDDDLDLTPSINITADRLRFDAVNGVGTDTARIETETNTIAIRVSAGSAWLDEEDGLSIGLVPAVMIHRVDSDGTTTLAGDADDLSGMSIVNGASLVLTSGGDTVLDQSLHATAGGNILISVTGSLILNADVTAEGGHISVLVSGSLTQNAAGDISTLGGGTIDVQAASIAMADGASASTGSGNIRYAATSAQSGTFQLGELSTTGNVSLSGTAITDAGSGLSDSINIEAGQLRISATTGFGADANAIESSITTLSASLGGGGLYLTETDDLIIGETAAIAVNRVLFNGTVINPDTSVSQVIDGVLNDVTSTGDVVLSVGGSLIDQDADGDSDLDIAASSLKLTAGNSIGAGDNHLELSVATLSAVATTGGLYLSETDAVTVGTVQGQSGLSSHDNLILVSGGNLTSTASVSSNTGNILLDVTGTLDVNADVTTTGGHISILATGVLTQTATGDIGSSGSGTIDVQAAVITMSDGATASTGSGNIRYNSTGALQLDALSTSGNVSLSGTAVTDAGSGVGDTVNVTADQLKISASSFGASDNLIETGITTMSGNVGSLYLNETDDLIIGDTLAISVNRIARNGSVGSQPQDSAQSDIASAGEVVLSVGGSLIDQDADGDSDLDIAASSLKLTAGNSIGAGDNHLELSVATLSAVATTGGLYLSETDAVTVGTVQGQSGLSSHDNLILVSGGNLTSTASVSSNTGNILLDVTGTLDVNTDVTTTGGHISILATGVLTQTATGDIGSSGSGTIDVQAAVITMSDGATASTGSGNIRYNSTGALQLGALSTSGNVSLSGTAVTDAGSGVGDTVNVTADQLKISASSFGASDNLIETGITTLSGNVGSLYLNETDDLIISDTLAISVNRIARNGSVGSQPQDGAQSDIASAGEVVLSVGGDLIDQDADGDSDLDIAASSLKLTAGNSIGAGVNHLEISVNTLTAEAGADGLYLTEENAITVGTVQGQSGLTSAGNLVLIGNTGDLVIDDAVGATGNVRLQAVNGDLNLNAPLDAGGGHISLLASGALTQVATGDVSTSGDGAIDVSANAISMADGAISTAGDGNIRYAATTSIALGSISTAGNVSLSGTVISDANADSLNIVANQLKLSVSDFGSAGNAIETSVTTLSADVGSLYLTENDDLIIGQTIALTVKRVQANGLLNDQTDAAQNDLASLGEVVLTLGGDLLDQDSDGDSDTDITATDLKLTVAGAIGSGGNHLEISVDSLSANAGSGLFLTEGDSIVVGTVQGQSGLISGGDLVLISAQNLTVNQLVTTTDVGNLLLAAGGSIDLNADVIGNGGHLSLLGDAGIDMAAGTRVQANTAGGIRLGASDVTADIVIADSAGIIAAAGNVTLQAGRDILLGGIESLAGNVYLKAGRDILDNGDTDLDVNALALLVEAGRDVGVADNHLDLAVDSLAGRVGSVSQAGSLYAGNAGDLDIVYSEFALQQVGIDGLVTDSNTPTLNGLTIHTGNLVLAVNAAGLETGTLRIAEDVAATNAGHVRLDAIGNLVIQAEIDAGSGHLSLLAGESLAMSAGVTAQTSGVGTVYVNAAAGDISMAGSANLSAADTSSMLLRAANQVELGNLVAGNVSVSAGVGSIRSAEGSSSNVSADTLRLQAGQAIGAGSKHLTTAVGTLTALAGGAGTGGIFITEVDAITIDSVGVTVSEFKLDASIDPAIDATAQADLVTGNNGHIVLNTLNGGITLIDGDADGNAVAAQGSGNIRLSSSETAEISVADIVVLASISSGSGSISLISADSIEQQADGDITTGGAGTHDLLASASILMSDGAVSQTAGGNIRYHAEIGDIAIGQISTGGNNAGQIAVLAGGNIADADNSDANDLIGKNLILHAGGSIGADDNFLDVSVVNLTSRSEVGATYIQSGPVNVNTDNFSVIVNRVENDGTTLTTGADTLQDLTADQDLYLLATSGNITIDAGTNDTGVTQARNIVLIAKQGDILINTGAGERGFLAYGNIKIIAEKGAVSINGGADSAGLFAYGNILIQAAEADESTAATIAIDARIGTLVNPADIGAVNYGYISLLADDDVLLADEALVDVGVIGKTLDLWAENAIVMADGGKLQTTNGNIRLEATTGDISIGQIVTGAAGVTTGQVAVVATAGSILDLSLDTTAAGLDIVARDLILTAGGAIATAANHLDIQVENLSALAGNGGLFIAEQDGIGVDDIDISVERVLDTWALAATQPGASQSDLSTGNNGHLVLIAANGGISLNDGDNNGVAVSAHGSGSILLAARGVGSDLNINADVQSTSGHVTLKASDSMSLAANVDIGSTGSISLDAESGALTMHGTANISAGNNSLRVAADDDITLGNLMAANVSILSGSGSIFNADNSTKNVSAANLRLQAEQAIGTASRHLTTAVGNLTALANGQINAGNPTIGLFISEDDAVTLTSVSVSVSDFNSDTTTSLVTDASQSGLTSAGNLILVSGGSLTGNSAVNAGGNLLLDVTGDLTANAAIETTGGHISLLASGTLTQAAAGDIATTGSGTIDVQANAINMADGASASSGSGNLRYAATTTLALGSLGTSGHVSLSGTAISDANADSLNVNANQLKLSATGTGTADNLIETSIATLSANVSSLYLSETDDLTLGDTTAQTVNRVQRNGTVNDQTDAQQSDLVSSGEVVLNLGGNLSDQDSDGDSDHRPQRQQPQTDRHRRHRQRRQPFGTQRRHPERQRQRPLPDGSQRPHHRHGARPVWPDQWRQPRPDQWR